MKTKEIYRRSLISAALSVALYSMPAAANDNFSGSIKGHVEVGSQAKITLTHNDKGITRSVTADDQGNYRLRRLPVGSYTVTISKPGFETEVIKDFVVTLGGQTLNTQLQDSSDIERIAITGSRLALVDQSSSTGGIVITQDQLDNLPVNTSINSIALLAPSATATSASSFGGSPNISGSSSAENSYFLNGINITNVRTGLGLVDIPFAAVAQTEVKVGGVSSEFGNALGGIVNAVSKSGSNDFEFGVKLRVDPESLRSRHDDILNRNGTNASYGNKYESDFTRVTLEASGPIIENSLFFYALYAPQENDYFDPGSSSTSIGKSKSDRYMGKIDWFINDEHSLEFTYINFENENKWTTYDYDYGTGVVGRRGGDGIATDGGSLTGIKYTALLSDDITLEVVGGRVIEKDESDASDAIPLVWSRWADNVWNKISAESASDVTDSKFTRDQFRADLTWDLDDHQFKFGIDYYDTHVDYISTQNGTGEGGSGSRGWWQLNIANEGNASIVGVAPGERYVRQRIRNDFSDSHVISTSIYAQDSWTVSDNLTLNLGVRVSEFENELSTGETYASVSGQVAPRFQAIFDPTGTGESKLYATWGRYFQPISANMNIVQGGSRHDEIWYYAPGDVGADGHAVLRADGSPDRGAQTGYLLQQDSALVSPTSVAHNDIKPMYADEITLGYETEILEGDMKAGVRVIHKELKRSIEDASLSTVITNWYRANGFETGGGSWILFNPGDEITLQADFNGDGTIDNIRMSPEEVGLPEAEREYAALEFTLKGRPMDALYLDATYTWSHLWGNTAGLVNQENNQADPGWTEFYDYAGIMDHSKGNLPSDRRHVFKLNGYYDLTEDLTLGVVSTLSSGTPISYMGIHPGGVGACAPGKPWQSCPSSQNRGHGSAFYDEDGNPRPRGSAGRTPFYTNVDLSLTYNMELFDNPLQLKGVVYNVFNTDTPTAVVQTGTRTVDDKTVHNVDWGRPRIRQGSRYVSLMATYKF